MWRRQRARTGATPRTIVLGTEQAAARQAEHRHRAEQETGLSPLNGIRYDADLEPEDVDKRVADFARAFRADPVRRVAMTSALTMDDFYVITAFAKRAARTALRTGDVDVALDGLDALSAIDHQRIDPRDISWSAAYLRMALCRIAAVPAADDGFVRAADIAGSGTAASLRSFVGTTYDGLCRGWLMRVVLYRGADTILNVGLDRYEPTLDLLRVTDDVRRVLETDYSTSDPALGHNVAPTWLQESPGCQEVMDRSRACVQIAARTDTTFELGQLFLAFVIETDTESDAARFDDSWKKSKRGFASALVRRGRFLLLLISSSVVVGVKPVESDRSLERFEPGLRAITER